MYEALISEIQKEVLAANATLEALKDKQRSVIRAMLLRGSKHGMHIGQKLASFPLPDNFHFIDITGRLEYVFGEGDEDYCEAFTSGLPRKLEELNINQLAELTDFVASKV